MVEIPPALARRMVSGALATCLLLVGLAGAAALRRRHALDALILSEASAHGVPPGLVASVIWRESRFDPRALGAAQEVGLMQISEGAVRDWAHAQGVDPPDPALLWDPAWNIRIGAWYLGRAGRHWRGAGCRDPWPMALAEYNAGRTQTRAWVEQGGTRSRDFVEAIAFPGTRRYVEQVLTRYRGGV